MVTTLGASTFAASRNARESPSAWRRASLRSPLCCAVVCSVGVALAPGIAMHGVALRNVQAARSAASFALRAVGSEIGWRGRFDVKLDMVTFLPVV
jgi:lipoate-protein ligase B